MDENMYVCSDTKLRATWVMRPGTCYACTNCGHTKSHGYPPRSIHLGRFCPNCGFGMTNPSYVHVEFDYD